MPQLAFHKGDYVPLEQASVGIMTHAFHYGTAVFEGIRGNWNDEEGRGYIFRLRDHYERMLRGCAVLHLDLPYSVEELCNITVEMVERCGYSEDIYIRPLAYKSTERVATLNLNTLDTDFTVFAIPFGAYMDLEAAAHCCTSSWKRPEDNMIPPGIKISGGYVNNILAKTDAVAAGFDEAILLNQAGYVCEGTGENLFIIRNGRLITPPLDDNILPGITRSTIMDVVKNEIGIEIEERHILRTELYVSDEIFLTGTAAHLTAVGKVDNRSIGDGTIGPITKELQKIYFGIIRGRNPKYLHWCTPVPQRLGKA